MDEQKHPNRVTCPKCGKPGTKLSRMIPRNEPNSTKDPCGPYWYVYHRDGSKVLNCYIGKNQPKVMESEAS